MNVERSEKRCLRTLCSLLGRTRQAYYQQIWAGERDSFCAELVIKEVRRIRQEQNRIGTRKIYDMMAAYREDHSIRMGRDAFFELLREEGLLVRKTGAKKPRTTFSCWWRKKYPNLIKGLVPDRPNRVWVSDITYIRVMNGRFCYLSLITDAYSRKIVGYCLHRDLSVIGCLNALQMAIDDNPEREGLIHHSDRGVQYYRAAST
jgi:putative transposase